MGVFDKVFPGLAQTLHKTLGTSATLYKIGTTRNPLTMVETQSSTTYAINLSPPSSYSSFLVDNDSILGSDLRATFAALDLNGDSLLPYVPSSFAVTFAGVTYKVVQVLPVYSGASIASYELQLRR